jgi:hypothetical protein
VTLVDYRVIDVAPDLIEAQFVAILEAANSPALGAAKAVYAYCVARRCSPAFLLAMFLRESVMGKAGTATITHSWGNTRAPVHGGVIPVRLTTPAEARSGTFPVFRDWIDGGIATVARWLDYAPYQGKTTVRQIIPTWAPASDGNSPESYSAGVLASIETWTAASAAKGGSMAVPKPTINSSHQSPNRNGYGGVRRVEAIVFHVTAGGFSGSIGWLTNPAAGASSNYLIDKDGATYELVPPDQDAWANGQVDHPDTSNPAIARWLREGVNFNQRTVSIETVRETSANNQPGGFTPAQRDSLIALTAWLCERFGVTPDRTHILRHAQIDSINRPYCPGLAESELQAWVGRIAALVKGGTVDQSQQIAGAVTPAHPDGYMTPGQADTFTWLGAEGIIVYRKVRFYNPTEKRWYEQEWSNETGFTPWEQVA